MYSLFAGPARASWRRGGPADDRIGHAPQSVSAQSSGEPEHRRPDPEAVVTPPDAVHDQVLPELARKALHPVNDRYRDMSINASRSLCQLSQLGTVLGRYGRGTLTEVGSL